MVFVECAIGGAITDCHPHANITLHCAGPDRECTASGISGMAFDNGCHRLIARPSVDWYVLGSYHKYLWASTSLYCCRFIVFVDERMDADGSSQRHHFRAGADHLPDWEQLRDGGLSRFVARSRTQRAAWRGIGIPGVNDDSGQCCQSWAGGVAVQSGKPQFGE